MNDQDPTPAAPANPSQGGSFVRQPDGELLQVEGTAPAAGGLRRHADDEHPIDDATPEA